MRKILPLLVLGGLGAMFLTMGGSGAQAQPQPGPSPYPNPFPPSPQPDPQPVAGNGGETNGGGGGEVNNGGGGETNGGVSNGSRIYNGAAHRPAGFFRADETSAE